MKDWAEVHRLRHREHKSTRQIAKDLKMSRTTVDRLLGLSEPPVYVHPRGSSLLDPFKEQVL